MMISEDGNALNCFCGAFRPEFLPVSVRTWTPLKLVYSIPHYSWSTKGFSFKSSYSFNNDALCGSKTFTTHSGKQKYIILQITSTTKWEEKTITNGNRSRNSRSRISFIQTKAFILTILYSFCGQNISGELHGSAINFSNNSSSVFSLNSFYHQQCTWILDSKVDRQLFIEVNKEEKKTQMKTFSSSHWLNLFGKCCMCFFFVALEN